MKTRPFPARLRRHALAAALALSAMVPAAAHAVDLASAGADQRWSLSPPEATAKGPRMHVELDDARGGPPLRLPLVVEPGTNYFASMTHALGTHANPAHPMTPMLGPERRLTLAVGPRADYLPRSQQRDKVHLTFVDARRRGDMSVDILRPEPRFVAFDIYFDPRYQLPPANHFLIHFQAGQGIRREDVPGGGPPPFSIRVGGTSKHQPDPYGPIDLMFLRRWYHRGMPEAREQWLPDELDALQRGRWYRLVLELEPGVERGDIRLWAWDLQHRYDRCDWPVHDWRVPWGYEPPRGADASQRSISYGVGIYRKAHERTQRLQFRNLRYGTTFDDVVPGRACG